MAVPGSPPRSLARLTAATALVITLIVGPATAASPVRGIQPQASADTGDRGDVALAPLEVDDPAVTSGLAWHLDAIGARAAWRASLGATVTVAVIDTGVDHAHPDLLGQVSRKATCLDTGGEMSACRPGAADDDGHGTHVAGLIAARADNGIGTAGVAPRARILAVRAAEHACSGASSCQASADPADLAAGIDWAVDAGASVVNLSIDPGRRVPTVLVDAIDNAWRAGSVVVMAAGNSSSGPLLFATGAALLVTGTDRAGNLAPYAPSLDAAPVAVAAPGGREGDTAWSCHVDGRAIGVLSTYSRGQGDRSGYACLSGTSMAAAQVSGGLALLLSMGFSRDEAVERLVSTATEGQGLADGQIDLAAAVAEPHPAGVTFRHDSLDNGAATAVPGPVPVVGPFARESSPARQLPSVWWFVVGGGLVLGLLTELLLRLSGSRHREPEPPSPHV